MDCPLKWTNIKSILFLIVTVNRALSENTRPGAPSSIGQTEYTKETTSASNSSPTPQLLNTLLTIAAANGVLPDLLPKIQPLGITSLETLVAQEVPKTVTVPITQQPTQIYQHEPVPAAAQPMVSQPYANSVTPSNLPNTYTTATSSLPVQPLVITPGLKQATQHNNPYIPQLSETVQTLSQMQALTQPMEETKTSTTPNKLTVNVPFENTKRQDSVVVCDNSILTTQSGQSFPINLQITIPPPNVEAPRITFINAALPNTIPNESSTSKLLDPFPYSNWYPYGYVTPIPPQNIIVKKKKSWLNDLLPYILFSMINNDHKHCNNDGRCCCSCNSGRRNTPVPYPIPIPTNNPIINIGCSSLSRKGGHKNDDDDNNDDWFVYSL